jgi:hypothetical protein
MAYVCGVKSITINLNKRWDLRCAWTTFLSDEILGCIVQISLEYLSRVSKHDTSTWYRLGCLSIDGCIEIYCIRSVSGQARSWQQFCCEIDYKLLNIDDSVDILNSFRTLVSGLPEIDMQQLIAIKLGSSGTPEHPDLICSFQNHNSTGSI